MFTLLRVGMRVGLDRKALLQVSVLMKCMLETNIYSYCTHIDMRLGVLWESQLMKIE